MPPNPNVSEIAVMTIENRSKMLADNMSPTTVRCSCD